MTTTVGQSYVFELKGNKYDEWIVVGMTHPSAETALAEPLPTTPVRLKSSLPLTEPTMDITEKSAAERKRVHEELLGSLQDKKTGGNNQMWKHHLQALAPPERKRIDHRNSGSFCLVTFVKLNIVKI